MTDSRTLDDVLDGLLFAMVTTASSSSPAVPFGTRPLTMAGQDGSTLRFLVSSTADWVTELGDGGPSIVSFADPKKNSYVAVQGTATVKQDQALVEKLWNPGASAYFDGKDDPNIRVLEVEVDSGEYWDGPSGRVGSALGVLAVKVTGDPSKNGDHGPVTT